MELRKSNKTALIFGASGLVGSYCLDMLLNHSAYAHVVSFSRRKLKKEHSKLIQHIIDFNRLKDYKELLKGDDVFLCLGTTMAKSKSKSAFIKVDFTYTYQAAALAKRRGANQVFLVSSVGANPDSLFFYMKIKGEVEKAIMQLGYWATHIFRPSVLLGERNENRFGEQIAARLGRGLDFVTGGLISKYKPIEAEYVAKAMVDAAQNFRSGTFVYPSHWLQEESEKEEALRKI